MSQPMPRVSIVLPNYNYAQYLDERIQSLLNQTYTDFELIILDDASTDDSIEVILKYTHDPRIKTKFYSENSGLPYKRWNDGADLAQGEYLLIAGADDSCEPTLLEKLVEKLDLYPSVGLALSQSWVTNSEGKCIGSMIDLTNTLSEGKERWESDFIDQGVNELKYLLFINTIPNASCVLMRRDVFIKAGKFDDSLIVIADWMLWSKILMISDIAFIAEPLNYFRTHPNTVRRQSAKSGVHIEEICLTKKYILNNSNLVFSPKTVTQAFEKIKWEWIGYVVDFPGAISLERNIKIYKYFSSVNSRVGWQLLSRLILQKIGIRGYVRKLKTKTQLTAN